MAIVRLTGTGGITSHSICGLPDNISYKVVHSGLLVCCTRAADQFRRYIFHLHTRPNSV
jgi:hypothetical protein